MEARFCEHVHLTWREMSLNLCLFTTFLFSWSLESSCGEDDKDVEELLEGIEADAKSAVLHVGDGCCDTKKGGLDPRWEAYGACGCTSKGLQFRSRYPDSRSSQAQHSLKMPFALQAAGEDKKKKKKSLKCSVVRGRTLLPSLRQLNSGLCPRALSPRNKKKKPKQGP